MTNRQIKNHSVKMPEALKDSRPLFLDLFLNRSVFTPVNPYELPIHCLHNRDQFLASTSNIDLSIFTGWRT